MDSFIVRGVSMRVVARHTKLKRQTRFDTKIMINQYTNMAANDVMFKPRIQIGLFEGFSGTGDCAGG